MLSITTTKRNSKIIGNRTIKCTKKTIIITEATALCLILIKDPTGRILEIKVTFTT